MKNIIFFFNFLSIIRSDKFVPNEPIIEPLELVLRTTDNEGLLHCNGRVNLRDQTRKLTASIENMNMTAPKFHFKIEQMNSTTIRIRVRPNGYIGVNRISCHWSDKLTFGQTADLIIGEPPGVIQLKERCVAFDRRYVQCIFQAPIIGRAFKNGFPRLYNFVELNQESYYRPVPRLVDINNENHLIFHFTPRDRHEFPKRSLMSVNMTIRRFGSSFYRFSLEPLHTTEVHFKLNDISSDRFKIDIAHNATGTISPRLCSGRISQIDQDKTWTAIQDIAATSDLKIEIERLRSSTEYEVCLKCYYEVDDQSYKEEQCRRAKTSSSSILYKVIGYVVILIVVLGVVGSVAYHKREKIKKCLQRSRHSSIHSSRKPSISSMAYMPADRYSRDPTTPSDRKTSTSEHDSENQNLVHETDPHTIEKYQFADDILKNLLTSKKISMDTYDLTPSANT